MSRIRVLIVDDQALIRKGIAMVLGATDDLEVVGEASDGLEAVSLAATLVPDIVLMDVQMPRMDGIDATRKITAVGPASRVIVLTTFDVDAYAFGGLDAGASGFLLKDSSSEDILAAVRAVAAGDAVLSPRITAELVRRYEALSSRAGDATTLVTENARQVAQERMRALTDRERDIFDAVVRGLSNAEIAQELWLSESTVKTHVGRVLQKLELRDRVQAVVFAFRNEVAP
ncbi:response regulator transcription factor [Agreia pratensis]|uniref:Two component transcriptional regulator, LuxR family n=1 Tax=Agreia pratensis TaxID=150121 RepID=A0A1X7IAY0_9MICO|nr:response regulator transcription factor [Agreia pratensis]MBF4633385.1 response regulator transcription factor [Agreia pratensis]SMG11631.1 two component transcriptional regulator, LuxR family [Agreia pratensis]